MSGRSYGRGRGRFHSGRNNFHRGGRIVDVEERLRRPRNFTGVVPGLLTLHFSDGRSNAHDMERFLDNMKNYCMANFFVGLDNIFEIDGKYPIVAEPEVPREREQENGMNAVVEAWKMKYKHFLEKKERLESDKAKLIGVIMGQMTAESKDRVQQTEDGRNAILEKDPLKLVKQIRATHLTSGNRTSSENLYFAQMRYSGIKMFEHGETIQQYMQRFDHEVDALKQAATAADEEGAAPTDQMQALHFIKRLNREYNNFKDAYERHLVRRRAKNVKEALEAALTYGKNEPVIEQEIQRRGAFLSAAKVNEYKGPWKPGNCSGCGQKGHWKRDCPNPHLWKTKSGVDQDVDKAVEEIRNKSGSGGQLKAGGGAMKSGGGRSEN